MPTPRAGGRPHAGLALSVALVTLCACAGPPPPAAPPRDLRVRSAAAARATTTIMGVVMAPPGLVAVGGGSVVSNNGAGLISDKGGAVVSSGGGQLIGKAKFRTQALSQAPLAGAEVFLADAAGKGVPGLPRGVTDGKGAFRLSGVPVGLTFVVTTAVRTADGRDGFLQALVRSAKEGGAVDVDVATTMVTAAVTEGLEAGLGTLDVPAYQAAVTATAQALAPGGLPDVADRAGLAEATRTLAAGRPELAKSLEGLKRAIARDVVAPAAVAAAVAEAAGGSPAPTTPPSSPGPSALPASPPAAAPPSPGAEPTPAAGFGVRSAPGDGGPATQAHLDGPEGLGFDAKGNLLIADTFGCRVRTVDPAGTILTLAGVGFGDRVPATSALLYQPAQAAVDPAGHLYVADEGIARLAKIDPAGEATTIPGPAGPARGVAVDGLGNLYVASGHQVFKVEAGTRAVSAFAGTGAAGSAGDGGPATACQLDTPRGLLVDRTGGLLIADAGNHRVRRVGADGAIRAFAGTGVDGASGDGGQASIATLGSPTGLATDAAGAIYIADATRHNVRKVDGSGTISTFAGAATSGQSGASGDGGPAVAALLASPSGVAVDEAGTVYIADAGNERVRRVDAAGGIATFAGTGVAGLRGDGGPATAAQLLRPVGVAVGGAGRVFIAEAGSHRLRLVDGTGKVSTYAGTDALGPQGDGGPAVSAPILGPMGPLRLPSGELIVVDLAGKVRRVDLAGTITTLAGAGEGDRPTGSVAEGGLAKGASLGPLAAAAFLTPSVLLVSDHGRHKVWRIDLAGGTITTFAGTGTEGFSGDGGPASAAQLRTPWGLAVDGAGTVYVACDTDHRVRRVTPDGTITSIAGTGVAGFSGDGGAATAAQLFYPLGLAVDGAGNLFIADRSNQRIRKVAPGGTITTVAGTGTPGSLGDGGQATAAELNHPTAVAVDAAGMLYIAETSGRRVRRVEPAGTISTFAGGVP